jgi:hypothetical protein
VASANELSARRATQEADAGVADATTLQTERIYLQVVNADSTPTLQYCTETQSDNCTDKWSNYPDDGLVDEVKDRVTLQLVSPSDWFLCTQPEDSDRPGWSSHPSGEDKPVTWRTKGTDARVKEKKVMACNNSNCSDSDDDNKCTDPILVVKPTSD